MLKELKPRLIALGFALAFMVGCGPESDQLQAEDGDTVLAARIHLPEEPVWETCPGASIEPDETGGYKTNPGDQCTLISKYNGDIDAGFDMSGANYDAFVACMTAAGCYTPGSGTQRTATCDQHLKDCQVHLVGAAAAGLTLDRKWGTVTADDWSSFGSALAN